MKNTKENEGKHEGKHERKSLTQQDSVTHVLDPRNTKRYKIHGQQGTIKVASSSPYGGLEGSSREGSSIHLGDLLHRGHEL